MSTLLSFVWFFAGFVVAALACCGIKALVWWAGHQRGRLLPRYSDRPVQMWIW